MLFDPEIIPAGIGIHRVQPRLHAGRDGRGVDALVQSCNHRVVGAVVSRVGRKSRGQHNVAIAQMPAIILYLGETLGLMPATPALRALTMKIVNDANDVIDEITLDGGRQMWTEKRWQDFRDSADDGSDGDELLEPASERPKGNYRDVQRGRKKLVLAITAGVGLFLLTAAIVLVLFLGKKSR